MKKRLEVNRLHESTDPGALDLQRENRIGRLLRARSIPSCAKKEKGEGYYGTMKEEKVLCRGASEIYLMGPPHEIESRTGMRNQERQPKKSHNHAESQHGQNLPLGRGG